MAERFWASTIEAGQSSVRGVAPVDRENGDVLGSGSGIGRSWCNDDRRVIRFLECGSVPLAKPEMKGRYQPVRE